MPDPSEPKIRLVRVSKDYGAHQVHALCDVSLMVAEGEFVALMGPSGCGKSTLLNLLGAMDQPTSGDIFMHVPTGRVNLSQMDDAGLTVFRREQVGFVFQFFNLLSTLTVRENVALPLELGGAKGRMREADRVRKVGEFLALVNLSERSDFFPAQLSGGEMQRAAIARALIHDPALILADEPTGNLDTENGSVILHLLKTIAKEQGKTIVMATHSEDAASYADRVIRIRDGRLVER